MNKISIEVPARETITKTFDLPLYRKNKEGLSFYKVEAESRYQHASIIGDQFNIGNATFAKCGIEIILKPDLIPCTPEEFDSAFDKVMDRLNQLKEQTA